MRLSDLARVNELEGALSDLSHLPGRLRDAEHTLTESEIADFVEWRRQKLRAELRGLGVDPDDTQEAAGTPVVRIEITPESKGRAAPQSGGTAAGLTLAEATAEAEWRIIPGVLADYAAGRIDDDKLQGARRRFADQIAALAQDIRKEPSGGGQRCDLCDATVTTMIAGTPYCATHAASAPRPAIPRLAR